LSGIILPTVLPAHRQIHALHAGSCAMGLYLAGK